jgi:hypothetical protein
MTLLQALDVQDDYLIILAYQAVLEFSGTSPTYQSSAVSKNQVRMGMLVLQKGQRRCILGRSYICSQYFNAKSWS